MNPLYCSQGHQNPTGSQFCLHCGEKLSHPQTTNPGTLTTGTLLSDRYRIVRELGRGGFGRTYLAEDINRFNEPCVLKEFAPQVQGTYALEKGQELFQREAGILYKLQHPQIPHFREMFRANTGTTSHLFLVQDYIEGQTYRQILTNRLQQGKLFTQPEINQLLLQILPVLDYIHSLGVIHRDISPDNIMLRNSDLLPVLIDFGGVKEIAATLESQFMAATATPATRLGKVGYAPDEQMQMGKVYPHSDLYSLAVTSLVLLTGKEPRFLRDDHTLSWIWRQYITLSSPLAEILDKMLEHRPADRYQSARQLIQILTPTPTPPAPAPAPPPKPDPTIATQAVSPVHHTPPNPTPAKPQTGLGANLILIMAMIITTGTIGLWAGKYWFSNNPKNPDIVENNDPNNHKNPDQVENNNNQPTTENNEPDPNPQYSPEEKQRKEDLRQSRIKLGIDYKFYSQLVDELFFLKNPKQKGRTLSNTPQDEQLREDWDKLAGETLNKLANISPAARQRLGSYTLDDINRFKTEINQRYLSGLSLNDLTDAKFFFLFPEQPRGEEIIKQYRYLGQVWQAIASEKVEAIKNGTALEEIKFAPGSTSAQISDTLEAGGGKAYIAYFYQQQLLNLNLEAGEGVLLSIYPTSSQQDPLLEDSKIHNYSGTLFDTGYYKIVVVSNSLKPMNYQLNVEVTSLTKKP